MKFFPLGDVQPVVQRSDSQDLTSILFQQTALLEGLQKELTKISLYPKSRRRKWLEEHQDFIYQMLLRIRYETRSVVDKLINDNQGLSQVAEYMMTLQQTLITLERITDEKPQLQS